MVTIELLGRLPSHRFPAGRPLGDGMSHPWQMAKISGISASTTKAEIARILPGHLTQKREIAAKIIRLCAAERSGKSGRCFNDFESQPSRDGSSYTLHYKEE